MEISLINSIGDSISFLNNVKTSQAISHDIH